MLWVGSVFIVLGSWILDMERKHEYYGIAGIIEKPPKDERGGLMSEG